MPSLRRRLLAALLLVGLLVFLAALWSALWLARERTEAQMASQARAVALALSVALTARPGEALAGAEALVEPVFDQSWLRRIAVRDAGGKVQVRRESPARLPGGAPDWFDRLLPVRGGAQQAAIMDGWRLAGSVEVVPHPHWATLQLWDLAKALALWLGLGLGAAALVGLGVLRWGLKPLEQVRRSAVAAASRRFQPIDSAGVPRELQALTGAFNDMLAAIDRALGEESDRAAHYRQLALEDALTGLANRRAFRAALEARMDGGGGATLALLRIDGLEQLNHHQGRAAVDALLSGSAELLRELAAGGLCARTEGACFALLSDEGEDSLRERLRGGLGRLDALARAAGATGPQCWRAGLAGRGVAADAAGWLAAADRALHRWQAEAGPAVARPGDAELPGTRLRERVRQGIAQGRLRFATQATHLLDAHGPGALLHLEARALIEEPDGRRLRAAEYLRYATETGVAAALDAACLAEGLRRATAPGVATPVAVNLGAPSLRPAQLPDWLAAHRTVAPHGALLLELPESVLLERPAAAEALARSAAEAGLALGIKHFGLDARAVGLLRRLRPRHVKFAPLLSREALAHEDAAGYLRSLTALCRTLGAVPVAVLVEDPGQFAPLHALGFGAVQGQAVAAERLDDEQGGG